MSIRVTIYLLSVVLVGCSSHIKGSFSKTSKDANTTILPLFTHTKGAPIISYEQNISRYLLAVKTTEVSSAVQSQYWYYYFRPWLENEIWIEQNEAMWPLRSYSSKKTFYGANLRMVAPQWFDDMRTSSRFEHYGELNITAITLRQSDLRNFPTQLPLFKNPLQAGEGYPFDYLQNSGISAMQPLLISHFSKDGLWAYVLSGFATGWIRREDIAYIPKPYTKQWMQAKQMHLLTENQPIVANKRDAKNQNITLFKSKIGQILPLIESNSTTYTLLAVGPRHDGNAHYYRVYVQADSASPEQNISAQQLGAVIEQLLHQQYGWGDSNALRDCSSTMRDLFSVFSIWLPRNSSQQAKIGTIIDLSSLTTKEKRARIVSMGVPFKTLLYRPGHILLYLGLFDDKILVLHNMWGAKLNKEGRSARALVGQCVISSLEVGSTLTYFDHNSSLLQTLSSMNILPTEQQGLRH